MTYKVKINPGNDQFEVIDAETILDAAIRQGVALPYGCRNGACGTCKSKVDSGQIFYTSGTPDALSEEDIANDLALCCMARPKSDLILYNDQIRSDKPIEPHHFNSTVVSMTRLNHDVMKLMLALADSERLQFRAGQYIDIQLDGGGRRAFSLGNAPQDDQLLELHVRLSPGGVFTSHVFSDMQVGDLLEIEGPLGQFYFDETSTRPMILVAGGTGFAPIKSLVEHALAKGVQKPVHLYWGARTTADLYLPDLPEHWCRQITNFTYTPVLSEPAESDRWTGRTGYVHEAIMHDYADLSTYEVYMCGPPQMVQAGLDHFPKRGLDKDHLHSDAFEYAIKK